MYSYECHARWNNMSSLQSNATLCDVALMIYDCNYYRICWTLRTLLYSFVLLLYGWTASTLETLVLSINARISSCIRLVCVESWFDLKFYTIARFYGRKCYCFNVIIRLHFVHSFQNKSICQNIAQTIIHIKHESPTKGG